MDSQNRSFQNSEINITNREGITVTGIEQVISYDENVICLIVCGIKTTIEGEDLLVTQLQLSEGKICAKGKVTGLFYEEGNVKKQGFLSGIFKS